MSVLKSISCIVRASRSQILKQYVSQLEVYRGLYSASSVGLDGYLEQRQKMKNQLANIQEKFKAKMKDNVEEGSNSMVFTEDLKNFVHLAEADDIDTVVKMIKKFNSQNRELRFGNFIFGPVLMRMFYVLDKPDEAYECFKSPDLKGFFDQLISYQLLCDLLYENKRYQDVLDCFEIIKERQIEGTKFPKNVVVLVYAACYRMNTPESLKYAMDLWKELQVVGHLPVRRAATFFVGLLLKHDKPEEALEVLASTKNQSYTSIRNLKLMALTKLNHLEETIPLLKSILSLEQINTFNKDILETVKDHIDKSNNVELQTEFNHIMKIFKDQNHISNLTLDDQLTSEITVSRLKDRNQDNSQNRRLWRPNQQPYRRYERARLQEMD